MFDELIGLKLQDAIKRLEEKGVKYSVISLSPSEQEGDELVVKIGNDGELFTYRFLLEPHE